MNFTLNFQIQKVNCNTTKVILKIKWFFVIATTQEAVIFLSILPQTSKNWVLKKSQLLATKNKKVENNNVNNIENIVVTEVTKSKTTIDSISNFKENKSSEVNVIKSKRKYYLNTVNLGEIKNIIFKNKANVEVLKYTPSKKENIIPIDVGTLPEGEYNILIENEKGIKPYKKVSIKQRQFSFILKNPRKSDY